MAVSVVLFSQDAWRIVFVYLLAQLVCIAIECGSVACYFLCKACVASCILTLEALLLLCTLFV